MDSFPIFDEKQLKDVKQNKEKQNKQNLLAHHNQTAGDQRWSADLESSQRKAIKLHSPCLEAGVDMLINFFPETVQTTTQQDNMLKALK